MVDQVPSPSADLDVGYTKHKWDFFLSSTIKQSVTQYYGQNRDQKCKRTTLIWNSFQFYDYCDQESISFHLLFDCNGGFRATSWRIMITIKPLLGWQKHWKAPLPLKDRQTFVRRNGYSCFTVIGFCLVLFTGVELFPSGRAIKIPVRQRDDFVYWGTDNIRPLMALWDASLDMCPWVNGGPRRNNIVTSQSSEFNWCTDADGELCVSLSCSSSQVVTLVNHKWCYVCRHLTIFSYFCS